MSSPARPGPPDVAGHRRRRDRPGHRVAGGPARPAGDGRRPGAGRGATHAAAGMLTPVAEAAYAERELFHLGRASLDRYPAFAAELTELTGLPTGFAPTGTLQVAYDGDDLAMLTEQHRLQESFGARRYAADRPRVPGGRADARPRRARRPAGGRRRVGRPAAAGRGPAGRGRAGRGARRAPGRDRGPRHGRQPGRGRGRRRAGRRQHRPSRWVVLAAGWQSARLAGLPPGAAPAVRPVKGQILRLRPRPGGGRPRRWPGPCAGWSAGPRSTWCRGRTARSWSAPPRRSWAADTTVTAGGVWELLRDARLLVPGITELELAEAMAGLRPGTPDNAPVLGAGRAAGPGAGHRPLPRRGAARPGDRRGHRRVPGHGAAFRSWPRRSPRPGSPGSASMREHGRADRD